MKYFLVIFALVFVLCSNLWSMKQYDVVQLKNGKQIKGKFVEISPGESIKIQTEEDSVYVFNMDEIDTFYTKSDEYPRQGSFGAGLGIEYGSLGLNADYNFSEKQAVQLGLGFGGFHLGVRQYAFDTQKCWRPSIGLNWGVNGITLKEEDGKDPEIDKIFTGFSISLRNQWIWGKAKRNGFDLDFAYIINSGYYDRYDKLKEANIESGKKAGRLAISFGYRYGY